jgi:hypothetical protein
MVVTWLQQAANCNSVEFSSRNCEFFLAMAAHALLDTLRCCLSGRLMNDPVIVMETNDPELIVGNSYERAEVEHRNCLGFSSRCVPNTCLRHFIDDLRGFLN